MESSKVVGNTKVVTEHLDYNTIEELAKKYGSSFYIFDVPKLRGNYLAFEKSFKSRYSNVIIGYSYKTNYLPYLCREMDQLGAYAEVVSRLEYDLALKIGVSPQKIIFNGPLKTYDDIKTALDQGSIINLDSFTEIEYVKSYCHENTAKQIRVGLRANFDISAGDQPVLQDGYELSRFGFCVANGNFQLAISELGRIKNLRIAGLHGHFSTRERKVETYKNITTGLCELAKQYIGSFIEYIDIGGGFYGDLPSSFNFHPPSFDDYAEAVCTIMNTQFSGSCRMPWLILEPGISLTANTFRFITRVIDIKKIQSTQFVLVDGSVHNIKPTGHNRNLPMELVKRHPLKNETGNYHIVGYTCMEKDYLAYEAVGEPPSQGDYIIFENVGAYTIVFNPPFIKERPGIIAVDKGDYFVVRRKESLREFFNEDLYIFK